ncbi:Tautomerase/MIF superfamily [Aspergillus heterothallicus]
MPQKRHRIDFSIIRRRQNLSSTSSSDLSPNVPVLESPISFQALTSQSISEATLKQNKLNRTPVKPSMFFEEKEEDEDGTVPNLTGGDPKDGRSARAVHRGGADDRLLSRTKSQFFEDSFSTRNPWISPSARMSQESLVVIEIKMNTRVKDENSIISRITARMAQIYQRSESLVVVSFQQGSCLQFGALTLPAYTMKIFALPYLIAPITNLRSTILIQAALHEIIHIAPARGVIIYIPVAEENMATNSTTMMGEIARLERETHDREPGIFKSLSRSLSRRKKSSSGQSVPLSVATTSSWAVGSDQPSAKQATHVGSDDTNASLEGSNGRSGRSSKTLRLFVSRRVPEKSGRSGDDE